MSNHSVGYGKPPRNTQFKKGQSGNPNGRPKGSTNPTDLINTLLRKRVTVTQNGKATKLPVIEVILTKVISKALGGDHKALRFVFDMAKAANQNTTSTSIAEAMAGCPSFDLSPEEAAVISKAKLLMGVS